MPEEEYEAVWNIWVVSCHGMKGESRGIGTIDPSDMTRSFFTCPVAWFKLIRKLRPTVRKQFIALKNSAICVRAPGKYPET